MDYYDQHADSFIDTTLTVDMRPIYRRFLPLVANAGRILDAGCGSGRDAANFQRLGYQVAAFDASRSMAEHASRLLGQSVQQATFQTIGYEQPFDGIWCCASLLHLPERELLPVLARLIGFLVTGGVLYTSFKYGTGERVDNGRHFTDMDEARIQRLLGSSTRLELVEQWLSGDQRPGRADECWINLIVRKL